MPLNDADYLKQRTLKRSVTIAGHATSVTLEGAFWDQLKAAAMARGVALNTLIADIDARRGENNLSSALRLYVLGLLAEKAADRIL